MTGIPHNSNDRLLPIQFVSSPNSVVPEIAPSARMAPIQADAFALIGPDGSGESTERSNGKNGDAHPIAQPCPKQPTLAA